MDNKELDILINLITKQQNEFLKRLDIITERNKEVDKTRIRCLTVIIIIWVLGFVIFK